MRPRYRSVLLVPVMRPAPSADTVSLGAPVLPLRRQVADLAGQHGASTPGTEGAAA